MKREHDRRAKLSAEQVAEIRELYEMGGVSQRLLAALYGVSPHAICLVVSDTARAREAAYKKEHPPKRRTKEEAAAYARELRARKKSLREKGEQE